MTIAKEKNQYKKNSEILPDIFNCINNFSEFLLSDDKSEHTHAFLCKNPATSQSENILLVLNIIEIENTTFGIDIGVGGPGKSSAHVT